MLKSILAIPFLPKLLCGRTKDATNSGIINPNYENTTAMCGTSHSTKMTYYDGDDILYGGQYVVYTGWLGAYHKDMIWKNEDLRWWPNWNVITHPHMIQSFNYDDDTFHYEIRKAESWTDIIKNRDNDTFAGVVRKQIQGPGLVEIYASKLSLEKMKNRPICFYDASAVI